jgi:hypothetical protein
VKNKLNIGECPKCGRVIILAAPVDAGVCTCKSAVLVPLLSEDEFFEEYTKKFGCTTEEALAVAMFLGAEEIKKMSVAEFLQKRSEFLKR